MGKREMEGRGGGGFFGKGANPITGSGAALVSLAALNSHFNGLFLPPPVPSSFFFFYLCFFLLFFSLLCLLTEMHSGTPHPSLSPSVCLSRLHERGKAIELYHRQSILSPYSCVMLRSERKPAAFPSACFTQRAAYRPSAEELQPGLIRSPYPSALPVTPEGVNG